MVSRILTKLGLVALFSLPMGCRSIGNYVADCYRDVPNKAVTGVTAPFIAVYSPFYHSRGSHPYSKCTGEDMQPVYGVGFTNSIPGAFALLGQGIYNLIATPLPLPSATRFMKRTAEKQRSAVYPFYSHGNKEQIVDFYRWARKLRF